MTQVPARLHVYLAREAPVGVVLCRARARQACLVAWNRDTDEFQVGQWVKHRVYEGSCDLSPDGRHFLYTGMAKGETYIGLSRVPYFTALAWTHGIGCMTNVGLFRDSHTFWMPDWGYRSRVTAQCPLRPVGTEQCPIAMDWGSRLERSGWSAQPDLGSRHGPQLYAVHRRPLSGPWALERSSDKRVCRDWVRVGHDGVYSLVNSQSGASIDYPDWTWADWDRHRLVWTTAGCLWTGKLRADGLTDIACLYDFNGLEFTEVKAPYEGVPRW